MNAARPTLATLLLMAATACDDSTPSTATDAAAATPAVTPLPAAPPAQAAPDVASMTSAAVVATAKVGVPVDVRYTLAGAAVKGQPTALDLAFVPRVEGGNLEITFPGSDSAAIVSGGAALAVAKADAASVHRRRLTVTPSTDSAEVRVQVSMDVAGGRYSSIFTIPMAPAAGTSAAKQ
jgi:hypothetical protein